MGAKELHLYQRNRIYISENQQKRIREYRIVLGGAGIGSVIAECALRMGFENICIIDGDRVEDTNLNRQNYLFADIEKYKAEVLYDRLKAINPMANISRHPVFITESNIKDLISDKFDLAVNALDFTSAVPFLFDEHCVKNNIPVLHPYNFGWAGCLFVVDRESVQLNNIQVKPQGFEVAFASFVARYLKFWNDRKPWLDELLDKLKDEKKAPPPQLSVGAWTVAAMCTNVMFLLATHGKVKKLPEFYFSTIMD